jgi:hypothetical protein
VVFKSSWALKLKAQKSNSARPPNPGRAQKDFLYVKKNFVLKILEPYRN